MFFNAPNSPKSFSNTSTILKKIFYACISLLQEQQENIVLKNVFKKCGLKYFFNTKTSTAIKQSLITMHKITSLFHNKEAFLALLWEVHCYK